MSKSGNRPPFVRSYSLLPGGTQTSAAQGAKAHHQQWPAVAVDQEWQRWVAENVLLRNDSTSIVDAMVRAGVDRATALREVQAAIDHPYIRAARQSQTAAASTAANLDAKIQKRDWVLECYRRSARQACS